MSYYITWLLIPGIGGLAITIYQLLIIKDVDTIFTSLYALLVCIWVTIFIERWKRKSAELCLRWGVSDVLNEMGETRILREEFIGYEYFSHETHNTERKSFNKRWHIFALSMQIPIFFILIGCCIATFFGNIRLKEVRSESAEFDKFISTFAGVLNGIIIAIIDKIYSWIATYFVKFENHKYKDSYEKSYVYKLFIFKFVNTNLSLFYTAFNDRDFNSLYYLILGMAITKSIQIFLLKNAKKYITFRVSKWWYFRRVSQAARQQKSKHEDYVRELENNRQLSS
jgi:Calcium-activated chloride channel